MAMNQNGKTTGVDETVKALGDTVLDTARDTASKAADRVDAGLDSVRRTAAKATATLSDSAGAALETVRDTVASGAEAARETLSDVGGRLAETLERASADVDGDALKSRVLSSVAQGITSASDALRQRSVAELTADVRTLARRHPGAFMAAAAVAGFAAARFIRSSAERRTAMDDHNRGHNQGGGPRV